MWSRALQTWRRQWLTNSSYLQRDKSPEETTMIDNFSSSVIPVTIASNPPTRDIWNSQCFVRAADNDRESIIVLNAHHQPRHEKFMINLQKILVKQTRLPGNTVVDLELTMLPPMLKYAIIFLLVPLVGVFIGNDRRQRQKYVRAGWQMLVNCIEWR